jgi:hypothetical protein
VAVAVVAVVGRLVALEAGRQLYEVHGPSRALVPNASPGRHLPASVALVAAVLLGVAACGAGPDDPAGRAPATTTTGTLPAEGRPGGP